MFINRAVTLAVMFHNASVEMAYGTAYVEFVAFVTDDFVDYVFSKA